MSNPLRNPNIAYERGWFSVAVQVAHNKSVFGAIVSEECKLNALGLHPPRRQPENAFELNHRKEILK